MTYLYSDRRNGNNTTGRDGCDIMIDMCDFYTISGIYPAVFKKNGCSFHAGSFLPDIFALKTKTKMKVRLSLYLYS